MCWTGRWCLFGCAATITTYHLMLNRHRILVVGRGTSHLYCLLILKLNVYQ
ncbi:MAG: Dihydroorotase [Sodalis sp.]|nr:MAG: Dihydroorotase [Sodalis sp.]